jgi:uncharacterized membrane protein YphA (DoxX/SURF4 family)
VSYDAPQPVERLATIRLLAPLCILGFLSSRFVHVEHWLTEIGFVVPDIGRDDYRQPLYIPPVPTWLAWTIAIATIAAGLATSAGYKTRWSSGAFAALLAYLALADRLEAFTVNKLGTVVAVALFATPCGARYGVDAWSRKQRDAAPLPTHVTWGNVRFFQLLLVVMYTASGIAKLKGGWLDTPNAIWSHLHDSYQTGFTYYMAARVPIVGWTAFQYVTLAYECLALVWFGLARTRPFALWVGLGMHATIGIMFGPVVWFSLLMMVLLVSCFGKVEWLEAGLARLWRE